MPDYLQSVRKKMEKQGVPEEEIKAQLADLAAQAKKRSVPGHAAVSSSEEALKKKILQLEADNHEWKVKYRELEQEFKVLKEELEEAKKLPPPFFDSPGVAMEESDVPAVDTIPDFLKE